MSDDTFDLYLIQAPETAFPSDDNTRGYNRDLLRAYKGSLPVQNIGDFIGKVIFESLRRHQKIKKLVIGSHGAGLPGGYGHFYIGENTLDVKDERIEYLSLIKPYLAADADVYILACKTGFDEPLLQRVSRVLGGVRVHGYTEFITTTNYLFFIDVDDGTDDGGRHIVCLPNKCVDYVPPPTKPPVFMSPRFRH